MKVLAISGSPRPQGRPRCFGNRAQGVRAMDWPEIAVAPPAKPPALPGLYQVHKDKNRCAQEDDFMPLFEAMAAADGLLVGSPDYFGSATPNLMALLDRAGYVARQGDNVFARKVGSPIVVARRAGVNFTTPSCHSGSASWGCMCPFHLLAHRLRPQTRRYRRRRRGPQNHHRPGG